MLYGGDIAKYGGLKEFLKLKLPELTDDMLERAVVNKGGRPKSENPRQLISLRLPPEVIERWRSTGPGWQTRMAERLAKGPVPRAKTDA
jgi:uncharacterized protein (DUF4415 family)